MADVKKLYDKNGTEIWPQTFAGCVSTNVPNQNMNVEDALGQILSRANAAFNLASGGAAIEGALGVRVTYANLQSANLDDAQGSDVVWGDMHLPNSAAPYTWKKTIYSWTVGETSTDVKTIYEIVATALYPETQVMYTAVSASEAEHLSGPKSYGDGVEDKNVSSTAEWNTFFEGIDLHNIYGYMAVRHREAGEDFPTEEEGGGWHISLFAQYPVTNNPGE